MTTILFDATRPVKTTRPARRFGSGILATYPHYMAPFTAADATFWAAESDRLERVRTIRTARIDREAVALNRLTSGVIFA
jgi:hypothetical protein